MKELQDLLHELRCDINYCKVSHENDTEMDNANDTLLKVENLVKNLTIPIVVGKSEQCYISHCENKGTTWIAENTLVCDDHCLL